MKTVNQTLTMNTEMGYKWTDAGTSEGRARLKELLDSKVKVAAKYKAGQDTIAGFIEFVPPHPKATNLRPVYAWVDDEIISEYGAGEIYWSKVKFIDPRQAVEPKPLEWVQPYESHKIAADGKYTYRIWDHGVAEYSENKGKSWRPIQKCESKYWGFKESEKAVYDWRMAIIKSMTE